MEGALQRALCVDFPLLGAVMLLSVLGFLILYSAGGENTALLTRQGVRLGAGFLVLIVLSRIPADRLPLWSPWIYAAGLILLLWVIFAGESGNGAQRWLDLGVVRFQPSEVMKLAVPMALAWYFSEMSLPPGVRQVGIAAVIVAVPAVLIAVQPDLGTALLVSCAGLFVIFFTGISWRLILSLGVLAAAAAPVLWHYMHDYQRTRVLTLLDPESDPLGSGYHIIQSKIAIGSGGMYGKGWLNGTQSQLDFVPERSTDFIFSVFGEEFGFLGALVLLIAYGFVVLRGLYIATRAPDTYSRLLAGGLSMSFFVCFFVNIGMVSGVLPVVGVPLPLISYGGTSLVTLMAAFGILMSIHSHRRLLTR
ncbi:MAG: rod shape-determining protein RodA [Pseudomonadota bacterium]|nr:rod shape-determining protein RodA [Pseudomonadota bacterium]